MSSWNNFHPGTMNLTSQTAAGGGHASSYFGQLWSTDGATGTEAFDARVNPTIAVASTGDVFEDGKASEGFTNVSLCDIVGVSHVPAPIRDLVRAVRHSQWRSARLIIK